MHFFVSLFWNRDERRLRAGWRIGLFVAITAVLSYASSFLPDAMGPVAGIVIVMLMTFLATWIAARFLDRRPYADFGWHLSPAWWRDLGFGLALGVVLMGGIFLVEYLAGWVTITGVLHSQTEGAPFFLAILTPLVLFICVGIYEELLFRGYLVRNVAEGLNFRKIGARNAIMIAVLLTSGIFGLAHANNPNATLISTISITFAGIMLSLGYIITRELAIPIGIHISWNFFQGHVFGFPVSGMTAEATSFITIKQGGPEIWTGGAFGPEAGLLGVIAMITGVVLILAWTQHTSGTRRISPLLAEPPHRS